MMATNPDYVPLDERKDDGPDPLEVVECLTQQGYTLGLAQSLIAETKKRNANPPSRIWIVDNSGSMQANDGYRILETRHRHQVKIVSCSRWEELRECVGYHVELAGLLRASTQFRLLNGQRGISEFTVRAVGDDVDEAKQIMRRVTPAGYTPLTERILCIHDFLAGTLGTPRRKHKRDDDLTLVVATDGLPTDDQGYGGQLITDQFISALRSLQGLSPSIWIVIRLCTNDPDVVSFYNSLDTHLELPLEVLDDFIDEAEEVRMHNPWLNYALPLHRCREIGLHNRVLDLIDERTLTKGELHDFLSFLFGRERCNTLPDPEVDWSGFVAGVDHLLSREEKQWNPSCKKLTPWIDVKQMNKTYRKNSWYWSKENDMPSTLFWAGVLVAILFRIIFHDILF